MYVAKIRIGLKKGVSDPEGNNTLKALRLLGFSRIEGVHTERILQLRVNASSPEEARAEADRACQRLLTNPIIHEFRIEVEAAK